jgi:hypothetical protein
VFPSVPIPIGTEGAGSLERGDIEVSGLEHGRQSYELRIFLNNPDADGQTEPTQANGYAASIYVYGYGDAPEGPDAGGSEHSGQRSVPITRSVIATEAVRAAAARGARASVTLVAVPYEATGAGIDLDLVDVSVLADGQASDVP